MLAYFLLGSFFGIVIVKSEAASWFRVQEMFRFQSFHIYGILLAAVATAALSLALMRKLGTRTLGGNAIAIPPKQLGTGRRYWIGGIIFGLGWALSGACPGPMFALAGSGIGVYALLVLSALAGTWVYGALRSTLPH
jgi:uncharacterized protein